MVYFSITNNKHARINNNTIDPIVMILTLLTMLMILIHGLKISFEQCDNIDEILGNKTFEQNVFDC